MARPKVSWPPRADILALVDGAGRLSIRVTPNASADAIILPTGEGILQVRATATPEGGKANEAVLRLLAAALGEPVSELELLRGSTGRNKIVRVVKPRAEPLTAARSKLAKSFHRQEKKGMTATFGAVGTGYGIGGNVGE